MLHATTLILLSTVLILLLRLVHSRLTSNHDYWSKLGVPYEKPFSIFGNLWPVLKGKEHLMHFFARLYKKFPDQPYFGTYLLHKPTLVLRDPELIRLVLVKDFEKFADRDFIVDKDNDPIAYHTMFLSKGAVWKAIRANLTPVFTSGKMRSMFPLIKECSDELVTYFAGGFTQSRKTVDSGDDFEIRSITKRYTVDVISSCAFGLRANSLKDHESEIMKMASGLVDPDSQFRGLSIFCIMFASSLVKFLGLTFSDRTSARFLVNVFKTTMKEREQNNIVRHDLIDHMNSLKKNETLKDELKFDDDKMASQAISFYSAGTDPSSITLCFSFFELALNPDVQDRLRKEIEVTLAKNNGNITYDMIHEMKYLDMVLNETLRKYPLTGFLNRLAIDDYKVNDTFTIEKNTNIEIPVCALHYDPKYFPDPEKFDPERFNAERKPSISPYVYLPFGEGPRNCIGKRFGRLVVKVALINSLKSFKFELGKSMKMPFKYSQRSLFLQIDGGTYLKVIPINK